MTPTKVKRLLKKLPHRKNVIISSRLKNISPVQVQCVFNGSITNPEIVNPVLKVAKKVAEETIIIPRKRMNAKKSTTKKTA
jgi:hypothetical protein